MPREYKSQTQKVTAASRTVSLCSFETWTDDPELSRTTFQLTTLISPLPRTHEPSIRVPRLQLLHHRLRLQFLETVPYGSDGNPSVAAEWWGEYSFVHFVSPSVHSLNRIVLFSADLKKLNTENNNNNIETAEEKKCKWRRPKIGTNTSKMHLLASSNV